MPLQPRGTQIGTPHECGSWLYFTTGKNTWNDTEENEICCNRMRAKKWHPTFSSCLEIVTLAIGDLWEPNQLAWLFSTISNFHEAVEEEEEFSTGYLFVNLDILMWCGEQQKQMMMMLHDIHKADVWLHWALLEKESLRHAADTICPVLGASRWCHTDTELLLYPFIHIKTFLMSWLSCIFSMVLLLEGVSHCQILSAFLWSFRSSCSCTATRKLFTHLCHHLASG